MMSRFDPYFSVPSLIAPAPWGLSGNGYVFLFKHSRKFLSENAFMTPYQKANLKAGIGAVMLVDYEESPVGPYQELLYIPGIFKFSGQYVFSISKIYVSSKDSQWNGFENWGIPKEVADFEIKRLSDTTEGWEVGRNGSPFFSVNITTKGLKFPLSTAMLPLKIGQYLRESLLITEPTAKGKGQLVKADNWNADPHFFPSNEESTYLFGFALQNFTMEFPASRRYKPE